MTRMYCISTWWMKSHFIICTINIINALVCLQSIDVSAATVLDGGSIVGEKVLRFEDSPFELHNDLYIEFGANLTIMPGVSVKIAPLVGIFVKGSITAVGTSEQRITLESMESLNYNTDLEYNPIHVKARLVDGTSPLAGRLQILHKGKWRSVCSNSRTWSKLDYETVCRQMGYQGGQFWNWMESSSPPEPRLLLEEPSCRGTELNIFKCNWISRQLGSGACDYHSDIGIQCLPFYDNVTSHWRGIKFINAPTQRSLANDNTVYEAISLSKLINIDIIRAGCGREKSVVSGIEVIGNPPILQDVLVDYSAYTGINVTHSESAFKLNNVTVRRSRGIGIFVNSSYGLMDIYNCNVHENGADGVKYFGHDLRPEERTDRSIIHDFCTLPTTAGQTYPISLVVQQSLYSSSNKSCGKYFFTRSDYVLTVSFMYFKTQKNESASIEIYDGSTYNDRMLGVWNIRNFTRPQSVTSTKEKIFIKFNAESRADILGYIRITTGALKAYDLNITKSTILNNGGNGVTIENMRSQLHIHKSEVSKNGHTAGINVNSGAGDVNITNSIISFNDGDGINITYYGGNRNISYSTVKSNKRYGLSVWINETTDKDRMEFLPFNQTTVVEYSNILSNLETGIRHGNFCGESWLNITGNVFNDSISNAIDVQTCWFNSSKKLNIYVGHNTFERNKMYSVFISPILNSDGKIEFNHFRKNERGCLHIKNPYIEEFAALKVNMLIQHNQFYHNEGTFVVSLGLSPYSDRLDQYLLFTRNFIRNNKIFEPFSGNENSHNPRSLVAAAVVLSSSNVDVFRNIISNSDSKYEIGSHLQDQSQILNVTYNWLGQSDEEKVFNRLFHRKDRYNLARIEYLPYLLHNSNPGTSTIVSFPTFVPHFFMEGFNTIGGEVDGQEILPPGTYIVERDINIRPGGKLIIHPGVTLNFVPNVGIMVSGKIEARGNYPDDILLTLKSEPVMSNGNESFESITADGTILDIATEVDVIMNDEQGTTSVRLVGGDNNLEGRLEVYLDQRWGTICDYGWTLIDASLACHQMGYSVNPLDWKYERSQVPSAETMVDVLLSNVRCTEMDTDLTKCVAEKVNDFENSCSHENDVGLKCIEGAWAGIRFGVLSERADLQYVTVKKAGQFDFTTNTFKPAIQMDFARHNLDHVRVIENMQDGLGVIYSDVFGGTSVNNVINSEFALNRGNGISMKQLGLRLQGCLINDNLGNGIDHNPIISAMEQRELAGWFQRSPDGNYVDMDKLHYLPSFKSNIELNIMEVRYFLTEKGVKGETIDLSINIRCQPGNVIGIQLLNPIKTGSTENIFIYDSLTGNSKSDIWDLRRDLIVFPTSSSSYGIVLRYTSGSNALGGAVMLLSVLKSPVQNIPKKIVRGPIPTLIISTSAIKRNSKGIMRTSYNRYRGQMGEHYLRKANESINILRSEISSNKGEAVFLYSPFWDMHTSNISEVSIHINNSLLSKNFGGIVHVSKDLRSSNNLFHYILNNSTIEANLKGGMEINLPYVWQYNENFTHSIFVGNCTFQNNKNFGVNIGGHYAVVNITDNRFLSNECQTGLLGFRGMEKKMSIYGNEILGNYGKFMVEFEADSLSEILGQVNAVFMKNQLIQNIGNKHFTRSAIQNSLKLLHDDVLNPSRVIGFKGIQKVRIKRNIIENNSMNYTLVAGIKSARLNNILDASENWWGSTNISEIAKSIFDFDNWNNHAEVIVRPYLLESDFEASMSVIFTDTKVIDLNMLGGRIYTNLSIWKRDVPYQIVSDITIMPGVTMTINQGVIMEFAPNVGILVLGCLQARGLREGEIIMRPITANENSNFGRIERSLEHMTSYDSIRLCTTRNCTHEEISIDKKYEGFLEYYNRTTLQWVPVCDNRFTERNAQVVCGELGFDSYASYFSHGKRYEFHTNSLTRIWSWVQPLECRGDESKFELCAERLNGQHYGRRHSCKWDDVFVFISCFRSDDPTSYWGGIRFANPDFEQNFNEHRTHGQSQILTEKYASYLEFVHILGAGILHGEKTSAIQTIFKSPAISSVFINDCAYHGVNLISPNNAIHLNFVEIKNCFGSGINAVSLNGEGREGEESSFIPLKNLDLPYNLFSLIDMCDTSKEIVIEERVVIYYKYDSFPINCVKIFKSAYQVKPLGFRLLQSNLLNHSSEYERSDAIELYDGDIYNTSSVLIGEIKANSSTQKLFYKTFTSILSVRLIASGAPSVNGFFAEIVTLPISAIGFNRDAQHNISNSEITNAWTGAITYVTAGEVSPVLTLESNRILNNCKKLFGNFSTCDSAIKIDVQNMQSLHFRNNLVKSNQGGLSIRADSRGSATSLRGYIHHNLFVNNTNKPSIILEGRRSSPYQEMNIYHNYFTQNNAVYNDVIVLNQVVSNFTYNYVHNNRGSRIIVITGFDKVRLPIYQTTTFNGFYDNIATDWNDRATVVAGTAGQQYMNNIFYNPENDYEMITVNRTNFNFQYLNRSADVWKTKIDATLNYWNYNHTLSVGSRIRDRSDNPMLLEVQFLPFHLNNQTILDGKCPPGWTQILDTCYMYVGAPMTFYEARDFCRQDNASMPYIRGDRTSLWQYLQREMNNLKYPESVWVQDINYIDQCTSFIYRTLDVEQCFLKKGFLCEIDPKVEIDPLAWKADIVVIGIISLFVLAVALLVLVGFCWCSKSRHRKLQRLHRRNSIRQSLRSLNSIDTHGSLRRRNPNSRSVDTLKNSLVSDYKKMTSNGSVESMEKSDASLEHLDIYGVQTPNKHRSKKAYGLPADNENSVELSYRNEGFRDNSIYDGTRTDSSATFLDNSSGNMALNKYESSGIDFYGNANTLPMSDIKKMFLSELQQQLPDYTMDKNHSSFLSKHTSNIPTTETEMSSTCSNENRNLDKQKSHIIKKNDNMYRDAKRPDSYNSAVRNRKDPVVNQPNPSFNRPRTIYNSSHQEEVPEYNRSKSEALLETNFDTDPSISVLNSDSRSYSQPLETAM